MAVDSLSMGAEGIREPQRRAVLVGQVAPHPRGDAGTHQLDPDKISAEPVVARCDPALDDLLTQAA